LEEWPVSRREAPSWKWLESGGGVVSGSFTEP
jgi:hypothetical protein